MGEGAPKFFTGKTRTKIALFLWWFTLAFMVFTSQNRRGPAGEAPGVLHQSFDRALSNEPGATPIRLCLRGPYFFCAKGSCPKLLGASPAGPRRFWLAKTIDHYKNVTKTSAIFVRVFPMKNFAGPRAPKYNVFYLKMHFLNFGHV